MKLRNLAVCVVGMIFQGAVHAAPVLIDFESDAAGVVPNGFISVDAPGVSFTDSVGADLQVFNAPPQTDGNSLTVFGDDPSTLIIDFLTPQMSISMDFGNDDACCSNPGDVAHLSVWMGGIFVDEAVVVLNRDDIMNQSIGYTGQPFDQAIFAYADPALNPINLIEIVDNIIIDSSASSLGGPVAIPTLSGWALVLLLISIGFIGLRKARFLA